MHEQQEGTPPPAVAEQPQFPTPQRPRVAPLTPRPGPGTGAFPVEDHFTPADPEVLGRVWEPADRPSPLREAMAEASAHRYRGGRAVTLASWVYGEYARVENADLEQPPYDLTRSDQLFFVTAVVSEPGRLVPRRDGKLSVQPAQFQTKFWGVTLAGYPPVPTVRLVRTVPAAAPSPEHSPGLTAVSYDMTRTLCRFLTMPAVITPDEMTFLYDYMVGEDGFFLTPVWAVPAALGADGEPIEISTARHGPQLHAQVGNPGTVPGSFLSHPDTILFFRPPQGGVPAFPVYREGRYQPGPQLTAYGFRLFPGDRPWITVCVDGRDPVRVPVPVSERSHPQPPPDRQPMPRRHGRR